MKRIPVAGPWITEAEIGAVTEAVTNAWYEQAGGPVQAFQDAFATYVGRDHAVALPSCTAGLHLALSALGVGPGDEVIVPDITWIASSAPITYLGATPVFADVDPQTLCLTADSVATCISARTRAVIVVDLYGAIPDFEAIQSVATGAGAAVIEDAAEAIGSRRSGRIAGGFGDVSVFSFHGSKTMTTGEGGMLVTDSEEILRRVDILRDHGRVPGDRAFNNAEVAFKYKLSSLQAALGLAQLERIDDLINRKRDIHGWYLDRLGHRSDVTVCSSSDQGIVWWMVSIQLDPSTGWDKDRLQAALSDVNIDSRPVFRPLSSLPAYVDQPQAAAARQRNIVSYELSPFGLNLPTALSLTEDDVHHVCEELTRILDATSPG